MRIGCGCDDILDGNTDNYVIFSHFIKLIQPYWTHNSYLEDQRGKIGSLNFKKMKIDKPKSEVSSLNKVLIPYIKKVKILNGKGSTWTESAIKTIGATHHFHHHHLTLARMASSRASKQY